MTVDELLHCEPGTRLFWRDPHEEGSCLFALDEWTRLPNSRWIRFHFPRLDSAETSCHNMLCHVDDIHRAKDVTVQEIQENFRKQLAKLLKGFIGTPVTPQVAAWVKAAYGRAIGRLLGSTLNPDDLVVTQSVDPDYPTDPSRISLRVTFQGDLSTLLAEALEQAKQVDSD